MQAVDTTSGQSQKLQAAALMREAGQGGIRDPHRSISDELLSSSGTPEEEFLRPDLRARATHLLHPW